MKKILFINACVRPESRTYILAKHVLDKLDGTVEGVELGKVRIPSLTWESLKKRDAYADKKDFSDPMFQYARQFVSADEIVIAAPYWDLLFPSVMRIYIEAVTVCGLCFGYTAEGCVQGLCKAKRIVYVTTAGGPIGVYNLGYDYIKALAQVCYGISEVVCYQAENLDVVGVDVEAIMRKAIAHIDAAEGLRA